MSEIRQGRWSFNHHHHHDPTTIIPIGQNNLMALGSIDFRINRKTSVSKWPVINFFDIFKVNDESAILETRVVLHAFKFLLKINRTWLAAQSVVDVEISILIGWICLFATLTYYQVWRQNILEIGIDSKQAQLCANSNNNLFTSSCAQNFATTFSR